MKFLKDFYKDKNVQIIFTSLGFALLSLSFFFPITNRLLEKESASFEIIFIYFCITTVLFFFFAQLSQLIFSKSIHAAEVEKEISKFSIKEVVEKIFDSTDFIKILQTALPIGEPDKEYGFDFVPFLLRDSHEKRGRYSKMATIFLASMITATIIFSGVIMYYGYILINNDSVGYRKEIVKLREEVKITHNSYSEYDENFNIKLLGVENSLKDVISYIGISNSKSKDRKDEFERKNTSIFTLVFKNEIIAELNSLLDSVNIENIKKIEKTISKIEERCRAKFLQNSDNGDNNSRPALIETDFTIDGKIVKKISKLREQVSEIVTSLSYYSNRIDKSLDTIEELKLSLNEKKELAPSNLAEIFKRIFTGVVVVSFLLTVLRFITNQYKKNYEKVLAVDEESSLIQKFYVAYKSSQTDEQREVAILKLLEIPNKPELKIEKSTGYLDNEMLKEILSTISKKL